MTPSTIDSLRPPTRRATLGIPKAAASNTVIPDDSATDMLIKTSDAAIAWATPSLDLPERCITPGCPASRSPPLPTMM